ncbi:MAG: dTDP-4-dehydrorhamnose 3,5-epimerase [Verrucomicrobiales bacterium]|nr:dTDP-4-dehydrorhamnose 3,5-epimerase [Verrucomicrobiales bacterium]
MIVIETKLSGVLVIEPKVFGDDRGFFLETFQKQRYADCDIDLEFVQDNHSHSKKGILRGMHFQKTKPQGKLVRCVRGEVFDVVVDINSTSDTFGQWEGFHLTAENKKQVWVPPGYAHGFQVLSAYADFEYKCTDYYDPADEGCLLWNDPAVGIEWPIPNHPVLSEKDQDGLSFGELVVSDKL